MWKRNTELSSVNSDDSRAVLEAKLESAERRLQQDADAARETFHWIYLAESDVIQLADGIVSNEMKALFRFALATEADVARNAQKSTTRKRKTA